ncbi:GntR family transcriptional regulator [bacterium]|nr:GntR family transcriptional regulator [bacterium]
MSETENPSQPIYQRLVEKYRESIIMQDFPPGSRIDSINEIMRRHRVSRESAKRVLKNLADEGLIIQKPGKGSFVSGLEPRKEAWAVVIPFFSAQMQGILLSMQEEAAKAGRDIDHYLSYNNWQEEIRLVGHLLRQGYEAIIIVPTFDETKTASFYRELATGRALVMLLDHTLSGSHFAYVIQSHDLGVRRAAQYLLNRSPQAVAFLKNPIGAGRNLVQEYMETVFRDQVKSGSPATRSLVIDRVQSLTSGWLEENRIQGIFCCDDMDAVTAVGRLLEWGFRIPHEISVISYGNTDLARYFTPGITSIDGHFEDMTRKTAEIIFQYQQGMDVRSQQHVILPTLIVRET